MSSVGLAGKDLGRIWGSGSALGLCSLTCPFHGHGWGLGFRGVSSGCRCPGSSGERRGAGRLSPHPALSGKGGRTSEEAEGGLPEGKEGPGRGEPGRMVSAGRGGGGQVCGAWLEGFGPGAPKPQPAFRPEARLALPAWLHLPSELGSAPSPQGSDPFPAEAPGLQWGLPPASPAARLWYKLPG